MVRSLDLQPPQITHRCTRLFYTDRLALELAHWKSFLVDAESPLIVEEMML